MTDINQNMFLDWSDIIENDGTEFITLDEGDYNFTVTGFERGRFPGGTKIPACNKASLSLQVETEKGVVNVRLDLLLYKTMEWKLSAFFRCIGMKKQGEKLSMNWNGIVGSKGRGHFNTRTYTDRDGNERTVNEIDRFYDYDEKFFEPENERPLINEDELPF